MKYKVKAKVSFIDKYTDKVYAVGEEIECSKERGEELLADKRGLVELIAKINSSEEPKEPEKKAAPRRTTKKTAE